MCFGLSAAAIETAIVAARDQFHTSTQGQDQIQCNDAASKAITTLQGIGKKGNGALKKAENLRNEIDGACKELLKLKGCSGQECFDFAQRWWYVCGVDCYTRVVQ
jgi:hypothetical protein